MSDDGRVYVTDENRRDLELSIELSERLPRTCQKQNHGKPSGKPIGACFRSNMAMRYWCGDCLKLYASNRIHELWSLIERERKGRGAAV